MTFGAEQKMDRISFNGNKAESDKLRILNPVPDCYDVFLFLN